MMLVKNVLLPTDFSENSFNSIVYALKYFENYECNFYLLHVVKLGQVVVDDPLFIPVKHIIDDDYLDPVKKRLRQLINILLHRNEKNNNHRFYTVVDFNFLIDAIRKQIIDKKIDFIVMGTKGESALKKRILGSNAADVITKVKCSTLIVPENCTFSKLEEVAFPTDYSSFYRIETLQPLLSMVESQVSQLRILYINKNNELLSDEQYTQKDILTDFFAEIDISFHQLTNRKAEDAIQCFVDSRDINLIVMVAKNLNYFQQILFHSKVKEISYHTDIPFLVLHDKS